MSGLYPYRDTRPSVDPTAFIAPGARIVGDVTLGAGTSVWFNAVIRADSASIVIGAGTNIPDCAVLHTDPGEVTRKLQETYLATVRGQVEQYRDWLEHVN